MSEFTQGKWEVDFIYGDHPIVTANDRIVADCFNNEANARLIAATPDMYELLKVWVQVQAQPTLRNAKDKARELLERIDGKEEQA